MILFEYCSLFDTRYVGQFIPARFGGCNKQLFDSRLPRLPYLATSETDPNGWVVTPNCWADQQVEHVLSPRVPWSPWSLLSPSFKKKQTII